MIFVKCSLFPSIFAVLLLLGLISFLLQHGNALNCKIDLEMETLKTASGKMSKKELCARPQATHCNAVFCSSAANGFYINAWNCETDGVESKAKCEKEGPDNVNGLRANLSAPTATDWKCKCHYGAQGKDMDNEQFVAASSRHGVEMPLMAIGLFIGMLPLFRGAILGRLNVVLEVNKF